MKHILSTPCLVLAYISEEKVAYCATIREAGEWMAANGFYATGEFGGVGCKDCEFYAENGMDLTDYPEGLEPLILWPRGLGYED